MGKQDTKTTKKVSLGLNIYKTVNKKNLFRLVISHLTSHSFIQKAVNLANICELSPWGINHQAVVSAFLHNFIFCVTDYLQTQTVPSGDLALAC